MLPKTSLKWGIVLGLAIVVGTQVLTWLGLGLSIWFPVVTYLSVIVFVASGLRDLKIRQAGKLTFLNAGLAVLIIILISRLIFQIYMFVYINYVDPNWVNTVAESWTQRMQDADIPADRIEQRISSFRNAWRPVNVFTVELLMYAIPQIVLGWMVSLLFVFRKQKMTGPSGNSSL